MRVWYGACVCGGVWCVQVGGVVMCAHAMHYPTAHPVAAARPRLARGPTSSSGGCLAPAGPRANQFIRRHCLEGGQSCRACRRACYGQGAWWEGCACCGVWHASESGHQRLECAAAEVRQVRNGVRKYCGWGSMGAYRCSVRPFLWRCGSTWQHRGHLQHTGPAQESCGRNLSPP